MNNNTFVRLRRFQGFFSSSPPYDIVEHIHNFWSFRLAMKFSPRSGGHNFELLVTLQECVLRG